MLPTRRIKGEWNTIKTLILVVIVILFTLFILGKGFSNFRSNTNCESQGGACVPETYSCEQPAHFSCPEKQRCCLE